MPSHRPPLAYGRVNLDLVFESPREHGGADPISPKRVRAHSLPNHPVYQHDQDQGRHPHPEPDQASPPPIVPTHPSNKQLPPIPCRLSRLVSVLRRPFHARGLAKDSGERGWDERSRADRDPAVPAVVPENFASADDVALGRGAEEPGGRAGHTGAQLTRDARQSRRVHASAHDDPSSSRTRGHRAQTGAEDTSRPDRGERTDSAPGRYPSKAEASLKQPRLFGPEELGANNDSYHELAKAQYAFPPTPESMVVKLKHELTDTETDSSHASTTGTWETPSEFMDPSLGSTRRAETFSLVQGTETLLSSNPEVLYAQRLHQCHDAHEALCKALLPDPDDVGRVGDQWQVVLAQRTEAVRENVGSIEKMLHDVEKYDPAPQSASGAYMRWLARHNKILKSLERITDTYRKFANRYSESPPRMNKLDGFINEVVQFARKFAHVAKSLQRSYQILRSVKIRDTCRGKYREVRTLVEEERIRRSQFKKDLNIQKEEFDRLQWSLREARRPVVFTKRSYDTITTSTD